MEIYTIRYSVDGYESPLPTRSLQVVATSANNALASALRRISFHQCIRRGAIAEAKRDGGRVWLGQTSFRRNRWAWVETAPALVDRDAIYSDDTH